MAIKVKDGQHYQHAKAGNKRFIRHDVSFTALERAEGDDDDMSTIRFSSDRAVTMWFGDEILVHSEDAVDLTRFNSGKSPVMKDHRRDSDGQIGVIEKAWIDEHYGYAAVRFSDSEDGKQYQRDLNRGIRDCFSIAYDVTDFETRNEDTDEAVYIATKWTPREVSFTPFPADDSAQAMRSERSDIMFTFEEESMAKEKTDETPDEALEETREETDETKQERAKVKPAETDKDKTRDAQMIMKLCEDIETLDTERGVQAIKDGKDFETFQGEVIKELANVRLNDDGDLEPDESVRYTGTDVPQEDIDKFRILNLIAGHENTDGLLGGFEREICQAEKDRLGKADIPSQGYSIPGSIVGSRSQFNQRKIEQAAKAARALTFSTDTEGGHLVDEKLLVENFIDILYANHPVSGAANWIHDVMGTIAIPKQDGRVVTAWTTETGDATESTPTFELIQMSPKELRGMVIWSRTFAMISSLDAENLARRNLMRQIGETADKALLYGTGTGQEIAGVSTIDAIDTSPNSQRTRYSTADGITYKECVNAIANVGNANAMGMMAQWILSWGFWEDAMTTTRLSHGDMAILEDDMIAGFKADATSQCNSTVGADTDRNQAFFANWEHLLVPMWGGIDIVVDPNTLLQQGNIRAVAFMRIDTGIAHDEAFQLLERTP